MKYAIYAAISLMMLIVGLFMLCLLNRDASDYIKFNIYHRDYLNWKSVGGELIDNYKEPLLQDRDRDALVRGIPEAEIVIKYPFLVPMDKFGPNTYKDEYRKNCGYGNSYRLYWFKNNDGSDWAVIIKDGIGLKLDLVKG
jgi:hypothetical protein